MDPSQKLLQELSNLTRNLDVLTKEIKESNKINVESQKTLSKSVENQSNKKESIPSASEKTTPGTKQKEGFIGKIENYFKEKPKTAEVEKSLSQPGRVVKDIMSSVAEKLIRVPKLEDGGRVTKDGVAMVGEKGPELVELQKASTVSSNDKIAELMKMELEDSKKKKETSEASKVISSGPKLNDFVTNSYGVKVPQKEIDEVRRNFEKESGGKDPDFVRDEIEAFIEGYRESSAVSSLPKLEGVVQPKEVKNPEESTKEKKTSIFEKLKSKLGGEKSSKGKVSAEVVNQTPELTEGERIKGELKKAYEESSLGKTVAGVKSLAKKFKEGKEGKSEMKKEEQTLKSESPKGTATPPTPDKGTSGSGTTPAETSKETPPSTPATTPNSGSTPPSSKSSGSSSSKPAEPGISAQDIQDIKSLLSAINTTLSGPLNVKDNKPFRPKSNMLE